MTIIIKIINRISSITISTISTINKTLDILSLYLTLLIIDNTNDTNNQGISIIHLLENTIPIKVEKNLTIKHIRDAIDKFISKTESKAKKLEQKLDNAA